MRRRRKPRRRRLALRKNEPERRCVATGESLTPETGLRFVISPDGELAPDFSGKLPGRGAWLTPDRSLLEAALKKGAFARSFRTGVKAPEDLAGRIEAGLAKQALSALGLARRAGDAVVGFEKVRAALEGGSVAVLVNAGDGGEDGRKKLAKAAGDAATVDCFAEAELAAALGRDGPTVHVALKAGPAAQRFLKEARRLTEFRRGS